MLRVSSVRRATPTSRIIRLDLQGRAFPYTPGQLAAIGPADRRERIPYSIASAPEESAVHGGIDFLVKLDASDRWGLQFEPLRRGARIAVRGPTGSFVFPAHPRERRFAFIAGGTGIAPLRSMLRHAVLSGPPGELRVLYSARTTRDFAYLRELRAMARAGTIGLTLNATREFPPRWRGGRGRIARSQLALLVEDPATLCFVCGPAAMVAEVPPMLIELGVDASRIRLEDW